MGEEQDYQPGSSTESQRSFSWLHRNRTDGGVEQKEQDKETFWWPVKVASGAALTPPPGGSAQARGAPPTKFSSDRGTNTPPLARLTGGKGRQGQKNQEAEGRLSGAR